MGTQVSKYSDMSLFSVNPILGGEITEREKKKIERLSETVSSDFL